MLNRIQKFGFTKAIPHYSIKLYRKIVNKLDKKKYNDVLYILPQ